MRMLDLFSGIGGFALAASWVWGDELDIAAFCEIDPFCQKVLQKHWPDVPIIEDIREYKHNGTAIDLVTGGYPCQAFSNASHGRIIASDLSPFMLQIIKTIQPKFVVAENVIAKTIYDFRRCMENNGYAASVYNIDAYGFGADHIRNRWWCVAHADNKSKLQSRIYEEVAIMRKIFKTAWSKENYTRTLRVYDGIPHRVDRLKSLGNAIVPQLAAEIMRAIKYVDESHPKI